MLSLPTRSSQESMDYPELLLELETNMESFQKAFNMAVPENNFASVTPNSLIGKKIEILVTIITILVYIIGISTTTS